MEIIDSHVHIRNTADLKGLQTSLQRAGIKSALVMGAPRLGQIWKHSGFENEQLLAALKDYPDLFPVIAADMRDPLGSIQEIEEILEHSMIAGVKIFPGYQPLKPDNKHLFCLYRFLERRGIPLLVHTGDPYRQPAHVDCARPVLLDKVAAHHPDLTIVICHLGNPWLMEAAEVICKNPRVIGEMAGLFLDQPGRFHDQYLEWLRRSLLDMFAFVGEIRNKFLFGSDWPVVDVSKCVDFARSLDLSAEDQADLFAGNARRIYGVFQ